MANTNIFDVNKKFVDLVGLDYFWGKAKSYIDTNDDKIASDLAALAKTVEDFMGEGDGSVVDQLNALKTELQGKLDAEAKDRGDEDVRLAGLISALRSEYEATKGRVDTFLDSEEISGTVDTLHEIQAWMNGEGVNATELTEAIAAEAKLRGEEDTRLAGLISDLEDALEAEAKSRGDKDDELAGLISDLEDALEAEAKSRGDEDVRLAGLISDMDAAYKAADSALETSLKAYSDANLAAANTYTDELFQSVQFVTEADINSLSAGWTKEVAGE